MNSRIAVLLLIAGCRGGAATRAEPASPPPPPDAAPGGAQLQVNIDGKPVAMAEAYVKRLAVDGSYQLFVTSKSSSCRELLDNLFDRREGEETLLVNLGPRLGADGGLPTVVTDVFIRGSGEVAPGSSAAVSGSTDAGGTAEVRLDYRAAGAGRTYEVHGRVPAKGCGARAPERDGVPKDQHASTAFVTLAGKKLPLAGAIRTGGNLVLSTGPKDCSGTTPWAAVILEKTGGAWQAHGTWLAAPQSNRSWIEHGEQAETRSLQVVPGAAGASADGPTVSLALSGSGKIGDYPVALEGTIEAIDCR